MVYFERAPNPALRPCIRSLWYCCAPLVCHRRERVLPNGCIQIVLSLARDHLTDCREDGPELKIAPAIIVGARQRYELIATEDLAELVGIVVEPGGFPELFRERADLFFEKTVPLNEVWSRFTVGPMLEAQTPASKLATLERLLQEHVGKPAERSPLVDRALRFLSRPNTNVKECARIAEISERRLSQLFREQVGISPKQWYRVRRFQTAVRDLHQGLELSWADLALRCGYYDQSHFINDFRAFSGLNPTTYCSRRGPWKIMLL